jgi:hypothetical protein
MWYPAGNYQATFDLALAHVTTGPTSKLVIEIVDHTFRCLAQRELSSVPSATECTLQFTINGSELFLEFRLFARDFADGELRFGGIMLRRHGLRKSFGMTDMYKLWRSRRRGSG